MWSSFGLNDEIGFVIINNDKCIFISKCIFLNGSEAVMVSIGR